MIGDDIIRATLPNVFSIRKENNLGDADLDELFDWINKNLDNTSTFIAPSQLRTACRMSIVFDVKGASMLIEGNPDAFVEWGKKRNLINECNNSLICQFKLYNKWGVNYVVSDKAYLTKLYEDFTAIEMCRRGKWALYQLNPNSGLLKNSKTTPNNL